MASTVFAGAFRGTKIEHNGQLYADISRRGDADLYFLRVREDHLEDLRSILYEASPSQADTIRSVKFEISIRGSVYPQIFDLLYLDGTGAMYSFYETELPFLRILLDLLIEQWDTLIAVDADMSTEYLGELIEYLSSTVIVNAYVDENGDVIFGHINGSTYNGGHVLRSHATNGVLFVKVQNGYEIDELHDVLVTSKAEGDVLQYEASTNLWKNKPKTPTGTMFTWTSSTIPSGWLDCDGTAVSRTTYAALYAVIGTTYGAGNGSTTFNLPYARAVTKTSTTGATTWGNLLDTKPYRMIIKT